MLPGRRSSSVRCDGHLQAGLVAGHLSATRASRGCDANIQGLCGRKDFEIREIDGGQRLGVLAGHLILRGEFAVHGAGFLGVFVVLVIVSGVFVLMPLVLVVMLRVLLFVFVAMVVVIGMLFFMIVVVIMVFMLVVIIVLMAHKVHGDVHQGAIRCCGWYKQAERAL